MAEKETRHQAYLTVYFCGSENCPPRHAYGPAVRPHYLLHVILKGRGIYQHFPPEMPFSFPRRR